MTERYLCVHGHFYQPPRQNPWLEELEAEDSAAPFHDWNQRITAECYAPNAAARIVDGEGRLLEIHNTYTQISFNFGPTLLAWLEKAHDEHSQALTYLKIDPVYDPLRGDPRFVRLLRRVGLDP
jgi:alpha-amylase/alpha-mannosidase (GH57 family)